MPTFESEYPDGPTNADEYISTQTYLIGQFMGYGFVCEAQTPYEWDDDILQWSGIIGCTGGIVIVSEKFFEAISASENRQELRLLAYRYNVHLQGICEIFRYDNFPGHPGLTGPHHKHEFDWHTGAETQVVQTCGCPRIDDVLSETYIWYCENRLELPNPDDCANFDTIRTD